MSFSKVFTAAISGIDTELVNVEVNIDPMGFPGFNIVGLASKEVDESKERVRAAIKNSGFSFINRKITINLAPADVSKKGSFFDLPIAIGILKASGDIKLDLSDYFFIGELSLDGKLNAVTGCVPLALEAMKLNKVICVPEQNIKELAIIKDLKFIAFSNLLEVTDHLNQVRLKLPVKLNVNKHNSDSDLTSNFNLIKGQVIAKRALEIAAAGGHNISLSGPPGSGKTMLARALITILPPLESDEVLEITRIYSIAGLLSDKNPYIETRPFRDPHHNVTKGGLLGGGSPIMPGDITLSHLGVLFLDEFYEFNKDLIESLRGPLEDSKIRISRIRKSIEFPANFMLVTASNPCMCGYLGSSQKDCICSYNQIKKYNEKISGPILDRIDLHVNVDKVPITDLKESKPEEDSKDILIRVVKARKLQTERFLKENPWLTNAKMSNDLVNKYCEIDANSRKYLEKAAINLNLSARAYFKILKISRTIADLNNQPQISIENIKEALQYRKK